jgi:hypothetical protein
MQCCSHGAMAVQKPLPCSVCCVLALSLCFCLKQTVMMLGASAGWDVPAQGATAQPHLKQLAGFWSADGVGACSERSSGFPRFFRFAIQ